MEYLATLENKTESTGWHSLLILTNTNQAINLQFDHDPSLSELQSAVSNNNTSYEEIRAENISFFEYSPLFKELILFIRNNPSVSSTQYNSFLASKQWFEAAILRFFLHRMAMVLAQRYSLVFSSYTEAQILSKLKIWVSETPLQLIGKLFFNDVNSFD